jgi:hypothetical protein
MQSNYNGQDLGEKAPVEQHRDVLESQKEFMDSIADDGLKETLETVTSGQAIACPKEEEITPASIVDTGATTTLDEIIQAAYKDEPSCRKVFTGNKGSYENPDIAFTKVMAYSMAQDMCANNHIAKVLNSPPMDKNDALTFDIFNPADAKKDMEGYHLAATYSLSYALAQRESSGNFRMGRDISANNVGGMTEEAGLTQTSPNSLNLKGKKGTEAEYLLLNIFNSYTSKLPTLDKAGKAALCLSDKLAGSRQSRNFDTSGAKLEALFAGGDCQDVGKIAKTTSGSDKINSCFRNLHKACPGFSIKYGAAVSRIRRAHQGPLVRHEEFKKGSAQKYFKPYIKPACHSMFLSIYQSKASICGEKVPEAEPVISADVPSSPLVSFELAATPPAKKVSILSEEPLELKLDQQVELTVPETEMPSSFLQPIPGSVTPE